MRRLLFLALTVASTHIYQPSVWAQVKYPPADTRNYVDLLKMPAIRAELEIADEQQKELEFVFLRRNAILGGALPQIEKMTVEDRAAASKQMREEVAEFDLEAYNVLLPFQKARIDQISNQLLIRASNSTAGLTHKRSIEALKLTDEQLQAIREKGVEVDAKLQEKLSALRKQITDEKNKAQRDILALLTEEQRKAYQTAIGELADLSAPQIAMPKKQPKK